MSEAPIDVQYDGGYFDKDEQGWVADPTRVVQVGPLLRVERGTSTTTFRLGRRWEHARLIELEAVNDPHPWWLLFDLEQGRLIGGSLPRSRSRTWPAPRSLADPVAGLAPILAACVAGTRILYPASSVTAPAREVLAEALVRPGDPRLDLPGEPGAFLVGWRRGTPGVAAATTRSASEVGEPFVSVGVDELGRATLYLSAPTLALMDAVCAAVDEVLRAG